MTPRYPFLCLLQDTPKVEGSNKLHCPLQSNKMQLHSSRITTLEKVGGGTGKELDTSTRFLSHTSAIFHHITDQKKYPIIKTQYRLRAFPPIYVVLFSHSRKYEHPSATQPSPNLYLIQREGQMTFTPTPKTNGYFHVVPSAVTHPNCTETTISTHKTISHRSTGGHRWTPQLFTK